jgi:hypothetical protein
MGVAAAYLDFDDEFAFLGLRQGDRLEREGLVQSAQEQRLRLDGHAGFVQWVEAAQKGRRAV